MQTIYVLLKNDHAEMLPMLERLSGGDQEPAERMAALLDAHSRAEEMAFYELLEKSEQTEGMIPEAYREHKAARKLAEELLDQKGHNLRFRAVAKLLQEAIEHHVKEEEGEMFEKAHRVLSEEQAMSVGVEFEQQKQRLLTAVR